ncbi:MAG: GspH/FimT family pseudopilin [Halieaceae bacterium]|nr:GspH/FimT family pseudopilin [Halieaceae bacterium]
MHSTRQVPPQLRARSGGFSLVELLVAVLVIVLLTTVVSLNVGVGGADIELENAVQDFADSVSFAQSEAELSGADHGLLIEFEGAGADAHYVGRWRRRYDQGWAPPRGAGEALADIRFSERTEILLLLEGQPEIEITSPDDVENPPPQLQIFASGEVTPGAIEWMDRTTGELLWRLEWDLFGRMTVMPRGELPDDA